MAQAAGDQSFEPDSVFEESTRYVTALQEGGGGGDDENGAIEVMRLEIRYEVLLTSHDNELQNIIADDENCSY